MRKLIPSPNKVMKAPDMFNPDLTQKFDKKTGQRLSYGYDPELFPEEPELTHEEQDPEQLNLFQC